LLGRAFLGFLVFDFAVAGLRGASESFDDKVDIVDVTVVEETVGASSCSGGT